MVICVSRLIRNIIITLFVGAIWLSWMYYAAPQLNSENTAYDTGICVSVESHTSWHGRFGAHTTYYILQLDNGNRYYMSKRFFSKSLQEQIEETRQINIIYYRTRHKALYDAKKAVEIQNGEDVYFSREDINQVHRNSRVFAWIFFVIVFSSVLCVSIALMEKKSNKSYEKIVFDNCEGISLLNNVRFYVENLKGIKKIDDMGDVRYYIKRSVLKSNCYVFVDVNLLNTDKFNDIKQHTIKILRKNCCFFANIFYVITVETSSDCFKKAMRNYVKQKYNRKTYYIGMVRSNHTLFLPNSSKRKIQQIKACACSKM